MDVTFFLDSSGFHRLRISDTTRFQMKKKKKPRRLKLVQTSRGERWVVENSFDGFRVLTVTYTDTPLVPTSPSKNLI